MKPASLSPLSQELLDAFYIFIPSEIYNLAPKSYIVRGFNYYRERRLLDIKWTDEDSFIATVKGSRLYSVCFFLKNGQLRHTCTCPAWSRETSCKHVICAILTIKNLLQPDSFRLPYQDISYREFLMGRLMGHSIEAVSEPPFSLILSKRYGTIEISIQKTGYIHMIPQELRDFVFYSYYSSDIKNRVLLQYLNRHADRYPIYLKADEGLIPVRWASSMRPECKTAIDASNGTVLVEKLCFENGMRCENLYMIGEWVFDLKEKRFGFLNDTGGWNAFNEIKRAALYDIHPEDIDGDLFDDSKERFILPIGEFQKLQFVFPSYRKKEILSNLILKVNGKEAAPSSGRHSYCLTISSPTDNRDICILRAECISGDMRSTPTKKVFDIFQRLYIGSDVSYALTVQKRRALIYKAFLEMTHAESKTEAERIIRSNLASGDFRKGLGGEAKRLLTSYYTALKVKEERLQFDGSRWQLIPLNKEKEAMLYSIPFEIFGWKIFKDIYSHAEMKVQSSHLYESLYTLYERLKEQGIELYFEGRPVQETKWDISFDVESGIDWFELKPEIRCSGEVIDETTFINAITNKGLFEKDGIIRVLDENTKEVLRAIEAISGRSSAQAGRKGILAVPRLQILDWIFLRGKGIKLRLPPEDEAIIDRLTNFKRIEWIPFPALKVKLRDYQKDGYQWLSFLYRHRFGACLADDMGLGKTIQAISLIAGIKEEKIAPPSKDILKHPNLIVLPTSLLFNWESEIKKVYPKLRVYTYAGIDRKPEFKGYDVILTTYGIVRRDIGVLRDIDFNVIIFDEAQAVKNILADTTDAARSLKGYFKLAMTGTPLENHIREYYSILDLALPGLLGDYGEFQKLIRADDSPVLERVIRRTRPFILRRTKDEILKELPPKVETDIYLELTEKQKALYRRTVEEVRATIDNAYKNKTQSQAKIIALTAILKLRQICISPRLLHPSFDKSSPKTEFLIERLKELKEEGHSALVFSQFTSFLDILVEELKENGIRHYRLDGSTRVKKRKEFVEGFQKSGDVPVFLLSLKAGGQGLNLTKASYVFHLDPWWNPQVESQASDRAHRIGQKNKVTVTRILMRHTIEEKMMQLKRRKLELFNRVMQGSLKDRNEALLSREDFEFLLG